jgi:hypothetical protein
MPWMWPIFVHYTSSSYIYMYIYICIYIYICDYGSKPWHLVNLKIAGKWMFIPLKLILIGLDPPKRKTYTCAGVEHSWLRAKPKIHGFFGGVKNPLLKRASHHSGPVRVLESSTTRRAPWPGLWRKATSLGLKISHTVVSTRISASPMGMVSP